MALNKLYPLRVKSETELNSKGTAPKVITTWHADFEEYTTTIRGKEVTKTRGCGPEVETDKSPVAIARGTYVNRDDLTETELDHLKTVTNVKRMVNPRYIGTVKMIRQLTTTIKNPYVEMSAELSEKLLDGLGAELAELERVLKGVKKSKETIKGIL